MFSKLCNTDIYPLQYSRLHPNSTFYNWFSYALGVSGFMFSKPFNAGSYITCQLSCKGVHIYTVIHMQRLTYTSSYIMHGVKCLEGRKLRCQREKKSKGRRRNVICKENGNTWFVKVFVNELIHTDRS